MSSSHSPPTPHNPLHTRSPAPPSRPPAAPPPSCSSACPRSPRKLFPPRSTRSPRPSLRARPRRLRHRARQSLRLSLPRDHPLHQRPLRRRLDPRRRRLRRRRQLALEHNARILVPPRGDTAALSAPNPLDPTLLRSLIDCQRSKNIDLVLPRFATGPNDALVNSALLYPLSRALFAPTFTSPSPSTPSSPRASPSASAPPPSASWPSTRAPPSSGRLPSQPPPASPFAKSPSAMPSPPRRRRRKLRPTSTPSSHPSPAPSSTTSKQVVLLAARTRHVRSLHPAIRPAPHR